MREDKLVDIYVLNYSFSYYIELDLVIRSFYSETGVHINNVLTHIKRILKFFNLTEENFVDSIDLYVVRYGGPAGYRNVIIENTMDFNQRFIVTHLFNSDEPEYSKVIGVK